MTCSRITNLTISSCPCLDLVSWLEHLVLCSLVYWAMVFRCLSCPQSWHDCLGISSDRRSECSSNIPLFLPHIPKNGSGSWSKFYSTDRLSRTWLPFRSLNNWKLYMELDSSSKTHSYCKPPLYAVLQTGYRNGMWNRYWEKCQKIRLAWKKRREAYHSRIPSRDRWGIMGWMPKASKPKPPLRTTLNLTWGVRNISRDRQVAT